MLIVTIYQLYLYSTTVMLWSYFPISNDHNYYYYYYYYYYDYNCDCDYCDYDCCNCCDYCDAIIMPHISSIVHIHEQVLYYHYIVYYLFITVIQSVVYY